MDKSPQRRLIDVFIFDGVNILDVAGPVQAFDDAAFNKTKMYSHRYVSINGKPIKASCGLVMMSEATLSEASQADDLLLPGGKGVDAYLDNVELQDVIQRWKNRRDDSRLISICSGSLLLAAAGVLDNEEATTHWSRSDQVRQRFPDVQWQFNKIYTSSKMIFTSAGVSTGIDLALSIIRQDCGSASALEVAQELVVYLKRSGGQNQFSSFLKGQYDLDDSLSRLVEKIIETPDRDWNLEAMADEAVMSSRTLSRNFSKIMNMTPIRFLEQIRVDHARNLLSSGVALKRVAVMSGFGDMQRMRRSFKRHLGVSLLEYMERFGSGSEGLAVQGR